MINKLWYDIRNVYEIFTVWEIIYDQIFNKVSRLYMKEQKQPPDVFCKNRCS